MTHRLEEDGTMTAPTAAPALTTCAPGQTASVPYQGTYASWAAKQRPTPPETSQACVAS